MNPTDRPVIAVFGSSQSRPGDAEYAAGVECGRLVAEAGLSVATGGYGGTMEAVCRGAAEAGGPTVGITAPTVFPGRTGANKWVHHELPAEDLVRRIAMLTDIASGYIALPGSIGTLAELVIAWNLAFVAPLSGESFGPIAAVGDTWLELMPLLTERLGSNDAMIALCPTVAAAVEHVTKSLP
ncbi:MAG: LOG family protein [Acidimicrobiia bacterium]|nr:LOG family protein [Acidimicrobiia bacterium]